MSIQVRDITKSFASLYALDNVNLAVENGEIHALLGANGSGKSTLVKLISGVYQPDAGTLTIGEHELDTIATPFEATELGVAVVHQEAPLIDNLSVAECIAMFRGYPTGVLGRVQWKRVRQDATVLLEKFGIGLSPDTPAGRLSPAERALVALGIALDRVQSNLQLLILDEVTASLPEDDAEIYLQKVRSLACGGIAVLMVTHRLRELKGMARNLTILRDGRVVCAGGVDELSDDVIVGEMIGSKKAVASETVGNRTGAVGRLWQAAQVVGDHYSGTPRSADAIRVDHLAGEILADVSFTVRRGEIVGIAGLVDGGVAELPNVLAGLLPRKSGSIAIGDTVLPVQSTPRDALAAGLVLLPADRLRNGGVPTLSVAENMLLPQLDRFWHAPRRQEQVVDTIIRELDVRPPTGKSLFGKLSGGNQQKVILGKWLVTRPVALVLDDPTSGVDPGAREIIFDILQDAAREDVGILLFSTEPEQLAAMCSRVLILKNGIVETELFGAGLTREAISRCCYA